MTEKKSLNIHQRIHAVMQDVSYVQKENKKVNNQYTFASHDAVTAKLRPALIKHGIIQAVSVDGHRQDGNRTEADVVVCFLNIDNPEDYIAVQAFGYGIDQQDKGPGKAVSYAVKYALLKTFALETGDDPEKDSIDHKPSATPAKKLRETITLPYLLKKIRGATTIDELEEVGRNYEDDIRIICKDPESKGQLKMAGTARRAELAKEEK